jgi:hypothetical protein
MKGYGPGTFGALNAADYDASEDPGSILMAHAQRGGEATQKGKAPLPALEEPLGKHWGMTWKQESSSRSSTPGR